MQTASGARAVQIVHSSRRGSRDIEHIGSAHDEAELEALKTAAKQRLAEDQRELDLGLDAAAGVGPLEITASRMAHLWDGLCRAYDALGFDAAAGRDEVFRQLVLARIIEPTSKQDSLRVLSEVGVQPAWVMSTLTAGPTRQSEGRHPSLSCGLSSAAGSLSQFRGWSRGPRRWGRRSRRRRSR